MKARHLAIRLFRSSMWPRRHMVLPRWSHSSPIHDFRSALVSFQLMNQAEWAGS